MGTDGMNCWQKKRFRRVMYIMRHVWLFAMAAALRRLPLRIFPSGVIRGYMAKNGMADSRIADTDDIVRVAEWMEDDAAVWLDEMKRVRDGIIPVYDLIPKNDERNKYCRL